MWKDFFYYSRSERRAVFVLLVLIAAMLGIMVVIPDEQNRLSGDSVSQDTLRTVHKEQVPGKKLNAMPHSAAIAVKLYPFDPNRVDSVGMLRLGLSSFVVRNVLKYRQKGGRFSTADDFSRIYGLADQTFETLKPYIRITEKRRTTKKEVFRQKLQEKKDTMRVFKYPEGTLVDVNQADTSELKKIPGIGSGISRAIVAYRTRLGGFHSLSQLEEIKFVTPDLIRWFKLENDSVCKLNVNRASLEKLRSHPYLNFYQAKVIVEHRRKRGKIKSLSQLSLYEEFSEKDLNRLSAYFSFD